MNTERIEGDRVADVVPRLIAEQFGRGITLADIKPESLLIADLHADLLDLIELVLTLEDEFGIQITEPEGDSLRTVKECIGLVERKLAGVPALPKMAHGVAP